MKNIKTRQFIHGLILVCGLVLMTGIKTDSNENGITLSRLDNLYGLTDSWGYRFTENNLTWIFFHKYIKKNL